MNVVNVEVDLTKLFKDTSELKYRRGFGVDSDYFSNTRSYGDTFIQYVHVTDAGERFINLFGLSVGVNSGDIALGYFPDGDSYIRVANLYDMMNKLMFSTNKRIIGDEDMRYILESIKLNPEMASVSVIDDVKDIASLNGFDIKYDSIILNAISYKNNKSFSKEVQRFFDKNSKDGIWLRKLIDGCIVISCDLEAVARDYFGNFISEESWSDVINNSSKSIGYLMNEKIPNMESLMIKYLSYGIPVDLLYGLKSYGFGVKQRRSLITPYMRGQIYNRINPKSLYSLAEALSSIAYVDNGANVPPLVRTYNMLDMIRSSGWEMNMLFSLDVIRQYKNYSLYQSLYKRFSLEDLMMECQISEKDFIINMDKYFNRFASMVDRGSMYSRNVSFKQYQFLIYSKRMMESSGSLFQKASEMVLKKF